MPKQFSYKDYVSDTTFMKGYSEYQKQYAGNIRESDKVLIELVRGIVQRDFGKGKQPALLDIGCSTGNLLLHLKRTLPDLAFTGGEMVEDILAQCRSNPELSGIQFEKMDLLTLGLEKRFDIIIANAVLYLFSEEEFDHAVSSVGRALKPNGWFLAFDFFHPFQQELAIFEKSKSHPQGLMLHFRSYSTVRATLKQYRFTSVDFKPFAIPISLNRPKDVENISTYTIGSDTGKRMLFRGTLYQPWCYLITQKEER